jgi:PAS domain S-box-containing protein
MPARHPSQRGILCDIKVSFFSRWNNTRIGLGPGQWSKPATLFVSSEIELMREDIAATVAAETQPTESPAAARPMSELVRDFNWASTPLGPLEKWPDALKNTVRILLTSRFSMWMAFGPELTVIYNDAYARTTLGKKHPWALGKPAATVWSEIWKDIGPRIRRVMETGEATWDETLMLFLERSGYPEETYHTFSYSPLDGPDGAIAGILCVVIEDTVRVIGERQLAALGALSAELAGAISMQEVFAAIERGLAQQKDMPCTLTYLLNEHGTHLHLVAKTGVDASHPAAAVTIELTREPEAWPIRSILESGRAATVENLPELFPQIPNGCWDRPPFRARLVPLKRQGQERPVGVFITALNPYRDFDSYYGEFLELSARQIAASITNARAYEDEKKRAEILAELDRAKTAFFSNVSHELRTPLTLILGPIEDALAAHQPPPLETVEMLHRNAQRLLKLVNGLLDFVRIEVGRMRATYEATDLSLFTTHVAGVFRSAIERAGIRLVVDCPPLPEPVYIDREMWEKIELNLLSNALKSTFEGEIRVEVSSAEGEARVTISDTGTGISEKDLGGLFERFQRIEGARRRSHEGSGIGLALVRELVEMHGGSINVASKVDRGTTFTVSVPLGHAHLPHDQVADDLQKPTALRGSSVAFVQEALGWLPGRGPRDMLDGTTHIESDGRANPDGDPAEKKPVILFADDNADMRAYVLGLLGWRFHVIEAGTGKVALEEAQRLRPDLVLSDVMMPDMDGFALLEALRQNPATRGVPVIMLSARAGEEARIGGLEAGADDYLTKPFSARELVARVEAQLKMARLRKEAAQQEAALTHEINKAQQFAWEALEHLPDGFCTFDREFRVTYINPAATEIAKRSGVVQMGKTLWELYPSFLGTEVETNFQRAMTERVPVEFEQYFRNEDGEAWFKFLLYPQPAEGVILYLRDTTSTQRTEQALRGSEQLAAAGRLAASIAHEINNPLEAVTNLLFLAKMDESVAGSTRSLLEVADRELQRLSHIAARSLKFYRQRTAPTLTSLEDLIESVLFFNEPDLKARNIRLERRHQQARPVLCLPGEIQQVMTNLISNALDALPAKGRLVVAVRPARDIEGREGVSVTVADSGHGMSRTTLDHLFHPFVTTKGEAGTGLGLWVSKGILDKHRSKIMVRSKPGAGTVIRLFVPLDTTVGPLGPAKS